MKNRKLIGLIAVIAAGISLTLPGLAMAGVDVHISIPLFGLFAAGVYAAAPPVYVAPAPPVYYAPYYAPQPVIEGAVFYGGYWYRPYGGKWFISAQAGGPWSFIAVERVPHAVVSGPVVMHRAPPTGYRHVAPVYGYGRGWYGR